MIRVLLVANPTCVAVFALVTGPNYFFERFAIGLVIAETTTVVGYAVAYSAVGLERWYLESRGLTLPERGRGHGLFLAGLSLPLGVYIGLNAASWVFGFPFSLGPNLLVGCLIGAAVLLTYGLMDARGRAREAEAAIERVELEARVSVLTAQMNPHLLFNALNTAAELVHTDADAAEEMILELAELYRKVLESSRETRHSLSSELEICDAYMTVQKHRFGERLRYTRAVDASIERFEVPTLILQPLVENAVLHGIGPKRSGGEVRVTCTAQGDGAALEVSDDGKGMDEAARNGTGLSNLRARLALSYRGGASVDVGESDAGGVRVRLFIPGGDACVS
ncbi:MAG: histidine kinase [Myxococcota bacterium]